jgi:hypothetical protein
MSFGISAATAAIVCGGLAAAGAVGGAVISSSASKNAAAQQAAAAGNAAALQEAQWEQTQQNLDPYLKLGTSGINPLLSAMGYNVTKNDDGTYSFNGTDSSNPLQQKFSYGAFNAPAAFTAPTAAEAQATPGYQFTLNQGLKAAQNSAAARGLGASGAALKGASNYATGLADSTYNDVFNRALNAYNTNFSTSKSAYDTNYNTAANTYQTNYNAAANNVNRLNGIVSNGQNAAATNGSLGAATASNIGNTLTGAANASASGTVGSANAISGGLSSLGNNALTASLLYQPTTNNAASYGAVNNANPAGYSVGSNSYGFTV